ncbi:L-type lectin-domain containing receptor kinase IX.1-like [Magnolia sinica]|uniref:L-type lectin-domain containing receptor kinase IX.1-like n=1 Tax=Magnolia sinica TaxID=86752 RepID=UPI002658FAB6|nr:L-type lectin-domain containing receptor kinase IX.1-like [Magnolia sinica]
MNLITTLEYNKLEAFALLNPRQSFDLSIQPHPTHQTLKNKLKFYYKQCYNHLFLNQAATISLVEPIYFSLSFDSDNCGRGGDLICFGAAASADGYVNLTPDPHAANANVVPVLEKYAGRVLYKQPMLAWPASFRTTFVIRISKNSNSITFGEGMAFIMAENSGPGPDNCYGGFLGLYNQSTQGNDNHQFAVELDTFMNDFDPDNNHVGIDTKSIISDATASLDAIGVDLKLGRTVKVRIEYDGWKKNLEILVAYYGDPLVSVLNRSIHMEKIVPPSAYVGFTASTENSAETHQIINWAFTTLPLPKYSLKDSGANKSNKILIITIPIVMGLLGLLLCLFLVIRKAKWPEKERKMMRVDIENRSRSAANAPKMFTFKQLSKATQNFGKLNLLGTGGFGSVYRGDISEPPFTIAVKRISATSAQGEREYFAEIRTIGRLRHKNIVQLHGWCHEHDRLLLVYEFMPNGSLDRFVSKGGFLDWPTRYKILTGLASSLLYLHEECNNIVIHRDVKPNNIMLDSDYNARLGDFGLARLVHNETAVTTKLAGTPGYLAPECTYTGKATTESDVFSFGIVVLEVVCGRRSLRMEHSNLVDYIWELYGKDHLIQGVDQRLEDKFDEDELKRALVVGLSCSHPDPRMRPTMRKVVQIFTNPNEPLIDLPESRPSAIYVPVLSPSGSANAFGSMANTSAAMSEVSIDDASFQCGR